MNGIFGPTWWSAWSGGLARQIELWALVAMGLALAWLLLLLLLRHGEGGAEGGRTEGASVPFDAAGPVAWEAAETTEEPSIVPVAVGAGAVSAEAAAARGASLSPTDLIALTSLRARIQSGLMTEDPLDAQHLEFARWLIEHGKLAE